MTIEITNDHMIVRSDVFDYANVTCFYLTVNKTVYIYTKFVDCSSKSVINEKQRSFQLLLTQNLLIIAIV